jgi:osmotically-inducible protein OsmY
MKTDLELQHDVTSALTQERVVPPGALGVEVHHGVVKLAGNITDGSVLNASAQAAKRIDGVTQVVLDVAPAGAKKPI